MPSQVVIKSEDIAVNEDKDDNCNDISASPPKRKTCSPEQPGTPTATTGNESGRILRSASKKRKNEDDDVRETDECGGSEDEKAGTKEISDGKDDSKPDSHTKVSEGGDEKKSDKNNIDVPSASSKKIEKEGEGAKEADECGGENAATKESGDVEDPAKKDGSVESSGGEDDKDKGTEASSDHETKNDKSKKRRAHTISCSSSRGGRSGSWRRIGHASFVNDSFVVHHPLIDPSQKDALLVLPPRKKKKKTPPTVHGGSSAFSSTAEANAAIHHNMALQAAMQQNNNLQMMMQQRVHMQAQNLMFQAAQRARAFTMQAADHNHASGLNCLIVTFDLPPVGQKLGLMLVDTQYNVPELKRLSDDSPLRDKIPEEYQKDCHIAHMKSDATGKVQPKTADECVKLIERARSKKSKGPVRIEMLLVKPKSRVGNEMQMPAPVANMQPFMYPWPNNMPYQQMGSMMQLPMQFANPHFVNTLNPPAPQKQMARRGNKSLSVWQKYWCNLAEYKELHGNLNVPPTQFPELCAWMQEQRERKKRGRLGKKKVAELNAIGFCWNDDGKEETDNSNGASSSTNKRKTKEQQEPPKVDPLILWDERFQAVARFKKRCGFFPASGFLHEWLEEQNEAVKRDALPLVRVKELFELGWEFPGVSAQQVEKAGPEFEEWYTDNIDADDDTTNVKDGQLKSPKRPKGRPPNSQKQGIPNKGRLAGYPFWQSGEAAQLFGFTRGDDVLKGLEERVALLRKANETANGWKSLVPNDGKEELYSHHEIMAVRHKAQLLIKAYLVAMKKMNKKNWSQCSEMASKEMSELGLTVNTGHSIRMWNTIFRKDNVFPHPKRHVVEKESTDTVRIFEYFPRAKEMLVSFAEENADCLTVKMMQDEFNTNILQTLERESTENGCYDDGSPGQKMLKRFLVKPARHELMNRWMHHLKIEWDKYSTRKGRNGSSYLSQRMKEAWASGKYTNRRPKGQGLKKGKSGNDEDECTPSHEVDTSV